MKRFGHIKIQSNIGKVILVLRYNGSWKMIILMGLTKQTNFNPIFKDVTAYQ